MEELKLKCCYIRYGRFWDPESKNSFVVHDDIDVARENLSKPLKLATHVRHQSLEGCFMPIDEEKAKHEKAEPVCLIQTFYEMLEACPIDTRKALVQNITLVGGGAMQVGFRPRFAQEIGRYLHKYSKPGVHADPSEPADQAGGEKDAKKKLSYHDRGFEPKMSDLSAVCPALLATWGGGSLWASLEGIEPYTQAQYLAGDQPPEWLAGPVV